jgi:hypothetical protein
MRDNKTCRNCVVQMPPRLRLLQLIQPIDHTSINAPSMNKNAEIRNLLSTMLRAATGHPRSLIPLQER